MVQYIDMTPTWRGVLPLLLAAVESGTFEGAKVAREELGRMADIADASNERAKAERPDGGDKPAYVAHLAYCVAAIRSAPADDLAAAMLSALPEVAALAEALRVTGQGNG